jgi:hypothetical protein
VLVKYSWKSSWCLLICSRLVAQTSSSNRAL